MTDTVSTTHPLDSFQQDVPEQDKLNHAQMIREIEVMHPPLESQGGELQHGHGKAEEEHTLRPVAEQGHRKGGLLSGMIGTAGAVAGSVAGKVLDVIGVHNPFDYDHEATEEPTKGAPETHGTHQHESQSTPLPSWSQEPRESFSNNTPRGEREGDHVEGLRGSEHEQVTTEGGSEGMVTDRLKDAPADQQPLNVGEGFIQDAPEAEPGAMMGRGETSILSADERRAATEPAEDRGQETMYPSVRDHIGATDKPQAYTQPGSGLLDERTGGGLGTSAGESARAGEEPMTSGLRLGDTPLPTPVEQRSDADSLNLVYNTVGGSKGQDEDVDVHSAPKGKDVEVGAFNGVVLLGGDHDLHKQGGDAGYMARDDAMRGAQTHEAPAGNLLSPGGDSGYMSGTSGEGTMNQMSQPVAPLEDVKHDPAFQGETAEGYHRREPFDVMDNGDGRVKGGPVVGGEQQETLSYGKGGEYGMNKGGEGLGDVVGAQGDAHKGSAEDAGFKTVSLNDEGSLTQQDQHEKKHQHQHVGGVRDRDDMDDDNSTGTGARSADFTATGSRDHPHHHEHEHHNILCVPTGCMPGLEALGSKLGLKKH